MTRATAKPVRRLVWGGVSLGDLVVEVRNDTVTLRQKGRRRDAALSVTWNSVFYRALEARIEAERKERKHRKRGAA